MPNAASNKSEALVNVSEAQVNLPDVSVVSPGASNVPVVPEMVPEVAEVQNNLKSYRALVDEEAELDFQLSIARKKRELMQLQATLSPVEYRSIVLGVLDAMVAKFDGSALQDVTKWIADLENVFALFYYSDTDKLVAARHLLRYAKRFIDIVAVQTFEDLKQALLSEFRRTFTIQDVFKQLKSCFIRAYETPRQYVVEMQYIACRANIPEAHLIDIINDGLNDKSSYVSMLYDVTL